MCKGVCYLTYANPPNWICVLPKLSVIPCSHVSCISQRVSRQIATLHRSARSTQIHCVYMPTSAPHSIADLHDYPCNKMAAHLPGVAYLHAHAKLEQPCVRLGQNSSVTFDAVIRAARPQQGTQLITCTLRYIQPDCTDIEEGTYNIDAKVCEKFRITNNVTYKHMQVVVFRPHTFDPSSAHDDEDIRLMGELLKVHVHELL
jgi:hypothetical protein